MDISSLLFEQFTIPERLIATTDKVIE